jgi:hypothetical protein
MGEKVTGTFGTREKPKPLSYVVGLVLAAVGAAAYFWLQDHLKSNGYKF